MFGLSQQVALAAIRYTITDLGSLSGTYVTPAKPSAINNRGQVVGFAQYTSSPGSPTRAFFWSAGGTMEELGTFPGGTNSSAADINDNGVVVGWADNAAGSDHAFIYRGSGPLEDLGTLGGAESEAVGINNNGQVVGKSDIAGSGYHTFLYGNGQMQDMGTLGGTSSNAFTINDNGQFVGWSHTVGNAAGHAYVYRNGAMEDLGTLGGTISYGVSINDSGQVAGFSSLAGAQAIHAFLWSQGGAMQDLGTLPAGASNYATGINKTGQVVGFTSDQRAFLYDGGSMVDLQDLIDPASGWVLTAAQDINDLGQIVGYGSHTVGGTVVGTAFLLTPVPEPAALILLALGGLAVMRRCRPNH